MLKRFIEFALLISVAVVIVIVVRIFIFQTFKIPSSSMEPTLEIGDRIIINKLVYGFNFPGVKDRVLAMKSPKRGDIVVFYRFSEYEDVNPEKHYVKRIVAIPGDKVEVKNYLTYVNDQFVDYGVRNKSLGITEQALESAEGAIENFPALVLKDDEYFVVGDNQANSKDSRFYGPINFNDIEGKVIFVFWSWNESLPYPAVRWNRVGKKVR